MKAIILDRSIGKSKASGKPFGIMKLIEQKAGSAFYNFGEFFCDPAMLEQVAEPGVYDVELGLGDFGDKPAIRSVKYLGKVSITVAKAPPTTQSV